MAFIVPGVCRFTLNQELESIAIANVLDMHIDTNGLFESRAEAVEDQAGVLLNQWVNDIMPNLVNDLIFQSVSWVDLDSADGTTGERTETGSESLPQNGAVTEQPLPSGVSILVRKLLTGGSRQRRTGRIYVTGVNKGITDPDDGNLLFAASRVVLQGDFDSFLGNINQDVSVPVTYTSELAVTHVLTRDANGVPLTGDFTPVSSLTVDPRFAFQRRRSGR